MDAQVTAVDAALRTVHAAALGAIAVVQQFGGQTAETGTLLSLEAERGNGGAVLPEIDDEVLAGADHHRFAFLIFAVDDNLAVCLCGGTLSRGIDVGPFRCECQFCQMIDLGTVFWHDDAFILLAHGRCLERHGHPIPLEITGIILLAVEDGGVCHRSRDAGPPVFGVGAVSACGAVGEGQLEHATEGTLLPVHAVASAGCDDFVGPPAGRYLGFEVVMLSLLLVELPGNVVGE